jgi:TolB-like protein
VRAIAVLPLENLSGDPSQDYFAAGLTDALTTELARAVGNSLRVTSRISAEKYKNKSLAQIARELNVDAVVEGSVIRSGNRARITVQLINTRAAKSRQVWRARYRSR